VGKLKESLDHTYGTINYIYTVSLHTDTQLLLLIYFLSQIHLARYLVACLYGEPLKYVCRTPRLVGECLQHSVVRITCIAQNPFTNFEFDRRTQFPYNIFDYCSICRVDCKFARNKKKFVKVLRFTCPPIEIIV
jgi:hypothetical protein